MTYHDTVTVQTPGSTTDRYGDTAPDWTTPTEVETPAWVGGDTTKETTTDGDRITLGLACHLPPDVTVTARSRIVWREDTYEIDGDPLPMSRRGVLHHYELTLKRVEG